MSGTWKSRSFGIAFAAAVTAFGLLANPVAGAAQSSREADGARLLKGAVDLHFHMDPWTPGSSSKTITNRRRRSPTTFARTSPGSSCTAASC
jgi:hypothetical protein